MSNENETEANHLWEADHKYYCNESNYFAEGNVCYTKHDSWSEFMEDGECRYPEQHLVFRWDWKIGWEETGDEENPSMQLLSIFWMVQRKGIFRCTEVVVTEEDEPVVREWLQKRFQHLMELWAPLKL